MSVLRLEQLQSAVAGRAAAFRSRVELQPAAGEGTKVFPPTYADREYAVENRRRPGREDPVPCVLLDSVQSQANRMEEALQAAVDAGRIKLPVIEVDFTPFFGDDVEDKTMRLIDPVGKISSLEAPHRIADAILRDSVVNDGEDKDKPFRDNNEKKESSFGQRLRRVSLQDATVLFELCPTALLLGMWDSTGPKGGLGAKFERAMVSEVVGIDAVFGVKTSSRIDPLSISKAAGPLYRTPDGRITLDPEEALDELKKGKPTGKKILYKKDGKGNDVPHEPGSDKYPDQGRPSEANHGNVTPSLSEKDREGNYLAGGVTIASAEQSIVLSLPALRRLRFPIDGRYDRSRDQAAQTVLAALGLCAAALADEAGLDLRSRCLLWPEKDLEWELLDRKEGAQFELPADAAVELFEQAVEAAKSAGLPWRDEPLQLRPSDQLVKLVAKSQQLAAEQTAVEDD